MWHVAGMRILTGPRFLFQIGTKMRIRHDLIEVVVGQSLQCRQARTVGERRGASLRMKGAWRRVSPFDR